MREMEIHGGGFLRPARAEPHTHGLRTIADLEIHATPARTYAHDLGSSEGRTTRSWAPQLADARTDCRLLARRHAAHARPTHAPRQIADRADELAEDAVEARHAAPRRMQRDVVRLDAVDRNRPVRRERPARPHHHGQGQRDDDREQPMAERAHERTQSKRCPPASSRGGGLCSSPPDRCSLPPW